MKTVISLEIENKKAELVLLDDNVTVQVLCDGSVVSSSSGETWDNLKDEKWAQEGMVRIEVGNYLRRKRIIKELQGVADEYF